MLPIGPKVSVLNCRHIDGLKFGLRSLFSQQQAEVPVLRPGYGCFPVCIMIYSSQSFEEGITLKLRNESSLLLFKQKYWE
jgi:hypothetical protein